MEDCNKTMHFKRGDRVTSNNPYSVAFRIVGTVIGKHTKRKSTVGVEFDEEIPDVHACEWNMDAAPGKQGHCWFVNANDLIIVKESNSDNRRKAEIY